MSYILVHVGLFECFHDPPLPWYNRPGWLGIKKNKLLTIIYQTLTGSTESSTCKCVLFAYIYTQGMLAYGLVQRYNATPKRIFTVAISTSLYRNPIYTTVQPTGLDTYPVPWCIRQQRLLVTWVDPGQRKWLLVVTAALTASSRHPDQARSKQKKTRQVSVCSAGISKTLLLCWHSCLKPSQGCASQVADTCDPLFCPHTQLSGQQVNGQRALILSYASPWAEVWTDV